MWMKGFCLIRATNCQVYLKINNVFSGLLNNQQVVVRNGIVRVHQVFLRNIRYPQLAKGVGQWNFTLQGSGTAEIFGLKSIFLNQPVGVWLNQTAHVEEKEAELRSGVTKTGSNSKPLNCSTGSMNAATWTVSSELNKTRVKSTPWRITDLPHFNQNMVLLSCSVTS